MVEFLSGVARDFSVDKVTITVHHYTIKVIHMPKSSYNASNITSL